MTNLTRSRYQKFYPYLPVFIVGLGLLGLGFIADQLNTTAQQQKLRDSVLEKVSILRARLEGSITSNAQLVRGLSAAISTEPRMSRERFIALSTPLLEEHSQLRNIAAAPDLVIHYMNPVAGNEAAIGLDYRSIPAQYESISRARDIGQLILAGPVNLVQGGQGFIARIPVFIDSAAKGERHFWGMISAVIDVDRLYTASGLYNSSETLDIAIRGKDATGLKGELIYGDEGVFASNPVLADIALPYGSWKIAAIPKGGWALHADSSSLFRYAIISIGLLILVPLFILGRIMQKKRDSDTRLRRLFELSPVGIALNDYDTGAFIEVNNALLSPTGYTFDEFIKLSYWDITPKKNLEQEAEQLAMLKQHGRYGPYEKEYIRKNGSHYSVRLNGILIEEASGEKMIWSFVEDISAQKLVEKQLQRSQKMDAIGQLTGGIAHDFNNILGIIIGNLDMLKLDLNRDKDTTYKRIDTALQAGKRASELTKKLLRFSRNTPGHQKIVNINTLIENMDSLIARSVRPEIEVTHQLTSDIWPAKIDTGDFEDALLNLSINARDAIDNQGHLRITTRNVSIDKAHAAAGHDIKPGDYIELSVSDDGAGFSSELQEHIFEPFYTTKKDGTGLGMAMVYGFVKRSGGFIQLESQPGAGTTVKIYLPRTSGSVQQKSSPNISKNDSIPGGNETILVVDDEIFLLELAKESLESMGYRVLCATDGKQALQLLDDEPGIALLFSDVLMPGGLNGYQLAEQARSKHPQLKVLLTSGYTGQEATQQFSSHAITDILSKPYREQDLATRVRAVLDVNRPGTD